MKDNSYGYSPKQKLAVCVAYAATSIAISLTYKTVLSAFHFEAEFFLLACQQTVGLVFCMFAQQYLSHSSLFNVAPFDLAKYKKALPVGSIFVFNIVVGFYGLKMTNVPMFLCVRRTTTLFTMLFEAIILGRIPSMRTRIAVTVIVTGTLIAGWESLSDNGLGFFFTILNNILTAAYLNLSRRFSDECNVKGFGLVYYNAITAVPMALLMAFVMGEFEYIAAFPDLMKPAFQGGLLLGAVLGITMTYVVMLCATVNSPLVTSITGNVKDIFATVTGALIFGFDATVMNVTGLLISFLGAGIFTHAKLTEQKPKEHDSSTSEDAKAPSFNKQVSTFNDDDIDSDSERADLLQRQK